MLAGDLQLTSPVASHSPHPPDPPEPSTVVREVVTSAPVDRLCCVGYADLTPLAVQRTLIDCGVFPTPAPEFSDVNPAGPTPVHPGETTPGIIPSPLLPDIPDEPAAVAIDFRHSFWQHARPRIREALKATGLDDEKLGRFDACGCNCWVMRADNDSRRFRLAADRCHNRWCAACAAERRRLVCRNLLTKLSARYDVPPRAPVKCLRFITVTLKSTDTPLSDQMTRILQCWSKLRERPKIRDLITGGVAFFEITRNTTTRLWHPHLHVLCEGEYIALELLKKEWLAVTGDSFVVDIRRIRTLAEACGYVAKYAAKGVTQAIINDRDSLQEVIVAFRGRRLFNTFGSFFKLALSQRPDDECGWIPVAPLHRLIADARAGSAEAIHILRVLRGASTDEPIDRQLPVPDTPAVSDLS